MNQIKELFSLILRQKGKLFLVVVFTVIFLFVLFPFDDLSDLVSSQVAKQTNNQVYIQFDKLRLGVSPIGIELQNVYLETAQFPALSVQELTASPDTSMLITQKPAGQVAAKGFLKGNVSVAIKPGGKTENGVERQSIELTAQTLSLQELRDFLSLPVLMKGRLNLESQALVDLAFVEQPDISINMKIDQFELMSSEIQTVMGPVPIPGFKLASVEMKGRLSSGRLQIEEGKIGKLGDDIVGTIKGSIGLQLQNQGGNISPLAGAYQFDVDLVLKSNFENKVGVYLSALDKYKSPATNGNRYALKLSAANTQVPPNFDSLR